MGIDILKREAPIAFKHVVPIEQISELEYRPITTLIPFDSRIEGELTIERFARDQKGRDFVVGISAKDAGIWIHKRHFAVDVKRQNREKYKAPSVPMTDGIRQYRTAKRCLTSFNSLERL